MLSDVVAECARRGYTPPQKTLAVLCLALDESWSTVPAGFFDQFDAIQHPTSDAFYDLAQLRGLPPTKWQEFKMRLYTHLPAALPFTLNPDEGDDLLSALTPDEQRELLTKVRAIFDDAHDTRLQLRGPNDAGWKQLGQNAKGQNLSFIDAVGRIKDKLFGTNNAAS